MTALAARANLDTGTNNANAQSGLLALYDALSEATEKPELDIASASTCNIGAMASTKLRITGTTTITSFGTVYRGPILIRMAGALTITYNATTMVCPGSANIVTAAGDVLMVWPKTTTSGTSNGWQVVMLARGDGLLPIPSASAAFTQIKQAATASATGVVELATDAEAQAGLDGTRCVTPDNLGAVVLGLGQSWQNVTGSRAVSTTYTNSTGRSILITVIGVLSIQHGYLILSINGSAGQFSSPAYANGGVVTLASALVQPGATYSVAPSSGSLSSITWLELR